MSGPPASDCDDFLILVNANDRTVPLSAPLVNGLFMECWKPDYAAGYTRDALRNAEKTLAWAEGNLRTPRINCPEGWRVVGDYKADRARRVVDRGTAENLRWMRLFTTLSLTHSDGYVLCGDDNAMPSPDHLHNWYPFWDADLGTPVTALPVAQLNARAAGGNRTRACVKAATAIWFRKRSYRSHGGNTRQATG